MKAIRNPFKSLKKCQFGENKEIFERFTTLSKELQDELLRLIALERDVNLPDLGYICRYRKALYSGSLGISLYLELFCFLSFISFVLRKLT